MDPEPGPSQDSGSRTRRDPPDFLSPRKKRPRGAFSATEKMVIINSYKYHIEHWPKTIEWSATECAKKIADQTGVSLASIYNIIKEYKRGEGLQEPKTGGPRLSFKDKLDEFTFSAIRRKVHQFYHQNEIPTIEKIHKVLDEDPDMPKMSKSTLRNVLFHLNFEYTSCKRRNAMTDRQDIILWRQRYLQEIKQYRSEGKFIYYQDETWVNEGHTVSKVWQDQSVKSSRDAFLQGLSMGLKAPTGKGRRLIICHLGSEEGFIDDSLLVFESKKGLADYHKEMNSQVFEKWFKEILQRVKPDSIIVLDNAPYHSRRIEKVPTKEWNKADIQAWLESKNLNYTPQMLKANLLQIVEQERHKYKKYVIDEMAKEKGVTVLRLPPYHCELNPIELIWAQVKGHVARNNKTFKMAEVKNLLIEGINNITPKKWQHYISHVIKEEDKMINLDPRMDQVCDRFIINVRDDSDDEDENSEVFFTLADSDCE